MRSPHLVLSLLFAPFVAAQEPPPAPKVRVKAELDPATFAATGAANLQLHFTAEQPIGRPLSVRIEVRSGGRILLRRDHAPPVPTKDWKANQPVDYALPIAFRTPPAGVNVGDPVDVGLGLYDPAADHTYAAPGTPILEGGLGRVARFPFPDLTAKPDAAAIDAVVASATALAQKQPAEAFDQLEFAFRRLDDYALKDTLQKALLQVGRMPPVPLTFEEQAIVNRRIHDERARYLRQIAGRMHDRGKLLGALLLLDEVGGSLQEDADKAVLGALADAKRVTQDRDGIVAKVFALSEAQEAELKELDAKTPKGEARLDLGVAMAKDKARRAVARELVRTLEFTPELRKEAEAARAEIEKAWLADVPADERTEAEAAMNHAAWKRTGTRVSHRFALIGPQALLDDIPADSLLRFDLAYLYVTDLFGRVPNPDGDRVTVYWKELWEFGGGVGGGKIIDIGNANAAAKDTRVDTGLLFHELTHCVDDTFPTYGGMREGLADLGAAFALFELHQVAAARASIGLAARAFQQDYLDRDLEYWRIPNYGPSAGFFLHFVQTYGKNGDRYRWELYRKFFRDYRECRVKDTRTPTLARAFAFHLVEAFGEKAFDDLIRFRWPLLPSDLAAARLEQESARTRRDPDGLVDAPGSPVARDNTAKDLRREGLGEEAHAQQLGVVRDWWIIGPFRKSGVDPDAYRFPPELEIDLKARYDSINSNPTWRNPGPKPVTVEATGWLSYEFAYMDDSAIYALTHVTSDAQQEAFFHLRADDDVTLFVNDELIGKHDFQRGAMGPWRPDWRVNLPDMVRFAVPLQKGRNKVLVKVKNASGPSGLVLAIAQRNGLPLPGWRTDLDGPTKKLSALDAPAGEKWPSRFKAKFDQSGAHKKLDESVGKWRSRNGALEGFANEKQVEWRKYTVRPGFPKDSPSNLTWLPEKATDKLDAFWLELQLPSDAQAPKACVIVQGDGQRDALCGWTLILEPHGEQVRGYLERYDLRVHMSDLVAWPKGDKKPIPLRLQYFGKRLTVKIGDAVMFDQAPLLPIPGKTRIGLATWGEQFRVEEIELRGPSRTK